MNDITDAFMGASLADASVEQAAEMYNGLSVMMQNISIAQNNEYYIPPSTYEKVNSLLIHFNIPPICMSCNRQSTTTSTDEGIPLCSKCAQDEYKLEKLLIS